MFYLVYVSSATQLFSKQGLINLLTQARRKNENLGITGMLLYREGAFMQVLEGEETVVRELYSTINQDRRHHGLITLDEGRLTERVFGEWSMGFRDLTDKELQSIPGFSQFMNMPFDGEDYLSDREACWALLKLFKGRA